MRNMLIAASVLGVLAAAAVLLAARLRPHDQHILYTDSFARNSTEEWRAYGGTWEVVDGAMRNESDERGAKLMTGSYDWSDYMLESDVELLGQEGDAGMIVRAEDEEEGVDAYHGYYAGLRTLDDRIVLGRADHGWVEFQGKPMPGGVHAFSWYHLRMAVQGCQITVTAIELATGARQSQTVRNDHCYKHGRIGLRSHSAGGIWKNVRVVKLPETGMPMADVLPSAGHNALSEVGNEAFERERLRQDAGSNARTHGESIGGRQRSAPAPINSLRAWVSPERPTVRGVVVLTSPRLYVQDATGGVAVLAEELPTLKVGDEVEATGDVLAQDFSATLTHAAVRLLWARAPLPAFAVTADQAATGAYDATYIEVEGRVEAKFTGPAGESVLDMRQGQQSFRALLRAGRGSGLLHSLLLHSLVRVRGICVVDPAFTANKTPFVLLIPSNEDVQVLGGPPWWSARQLAILGLVLLSLLLMAYLVYLRARHWRLHAIFDERERLAHEMHDTFAQSFAGIGYQLQAIRNRLPENANGLDQQLDLACDLVRHSHEEARQSLATLRSDHLGSLDLRDALQECAHRMLDGGSVEVKVIARGEDTGIPLRYRDTFFRIGQEAIANSIRHAMPRRVTIHLDYARDHLTMLIEDDGRGFDPQQEARGFGLGGMKKRAAMVAAEFTVQSSPGAGTRIQVRASRHAGQAWFVGVFSALRRPPASSPGRESHDPYSYRR